MRNGQSQQRRAGYLLSPTERLGQKEGDERGLAFEEIARARGRMLVLAMHTAPQAYQAPRKQAFYCPKTLAYISVPLGKSSRGRPREGVEVYPGPKYQSRDQHLNR